jgi:light-regulated signal transduction histidine kinase (bacteriophytochrome)
LGFRSPAELVGKDAASFYVNAEDRMRFRRLAEQSDHVVGFETQMRHCNGSNIWTRAHCHIHRDANGRVDRYDSCVEDITDLRKLQESHQRLNESLEERVKARTAALEDANAEREAFAYSVSHDLRAPLRRIDGFSQAVLEDFDDKLGDEGREHLRRVCEAAGHMDRLIDAILRLSRVTRGDMFPEPVDLSQIAERIVARLRAEAPNRDVAVSILPGIMGIGEVRLIEVAMENLLANAWKFTSRTPHASIEFGAERSPGGIVYYVRDNGAGFDMAGAKDLFAPFQRLHRAEDFPGIGIGLATVKRIIARHGGRIWGVGEAGKGATFRFTLAPVDVSLAQAQLNDTRDGSDFVPEAAQRNQRSERMT